MKHVSFSAAGANQIVIKLDSDRKLEEDVEGIGVYTSNRREVELVKWRLLRL